MRVSFRLLAGICTAVLLGLGSAQAQSVPPFIAKHIRANLTYESFLSQVMQPFRAMAQRERQSTIDVEKVERTITATKLQMEQQSIARYMGFDRNTDGKVTEEEIRQTLAERQQTNQFATSDYMNSTQYVDRQVQELMRADTNHDGVVDVAEMKAAASASPYGMMNQYGNLRDYFVWAQDGKLSAAILIRNARKVFEAIDTNHDETISADEALALQHADDGTVRTQEPVRADEAPKPTQAPPPAPRRHRDR